MRTSFIPRPAARFIARFAARFIAVATLFAAAVSTPLAAEPSTPLVEPWVGETPFPTRSELRFPDGIAYVDAVQDCDADPERAFLHETAVGFDGNELWLGWYNNPEKELTGETIQRARRSLDGGETWSEPEIVCDRDADGGLMSVGLQFFGANGEFYALTNRESAAERPVACFLLKRDRESNGGSSDGDSANGAATSGESTNGGASDGDSGSWREIGPIAPRFLSMQAPVRNAAGNWIVSGSYNPKPGDMFGYLPCVCVSQGDDVEKPWRRYLIDDEFVNVFAETSIVVDGPNVLATTRREESVFPNFYTSSDFGRTWTKLTNDSFPTASSKFAAGVLSNGKRYLIFNAIEFSRGADGKIDLSAPTNRDRQTLAIALANPDAKGFGVVYKLSDPSVSDARRFSHYPCAVERDGKLFVSHTGERGRRNASLIVVPIESLR